MSPAKGETEMLDLLAIGEALLLKPTKDWTREEVGIALDLIREHQGGDLMVILGLITWQLSWALAWKRALAPQGNQTPER